MRSACRRATSTSVSSAIAILRPLALAATEELDDLRRDNLRAVEEDEMPTATNDVQPCTRDQPRHDPVVDQRCDRIVIPADDERRLEDGRQPGETRPCPKRERPKEGSANASRAR